MQRTEVSDMPYMEDIDEWARQTTITHTFLNRNCFSNYITTILYNIGNYITTVFAGINNKQTSAP